ncbi:hypothetical protein [Marilutibacter alkalisoli]|uniref:Uncharacterized protein n=1 Tax=Marilutibacter alkalisoli TaxID=2591633 RepID=A0A514BSI8_9GAMM|nr:hypothetical protein [Lysobacter alkalisoli]QDH70354.1 hypothetical protein FKV23_09815 [Lysobacter alkalisoli]
MILSTELREYNSYSSDPRSARLHNNFEAFMERAERNRPVMEQAEFEFEASGEGREALGEDGSDSWKE